MQIGLEDFDVILSQAYQWSSIILGVLIAIRVLTWGIDWLIVNVFGFERLGLS